MTASQPRRKKIGILIESHFDEGEFRRFNEYFPEHGYEVEYLSYLWGQPELTFVGIDLTEKVTVTVDVTSVEPGDYAGIVLIGAYAMDRLRYEEHPREGQLNQAPAVAFIRRAMATPGLTVGTVCHGLWLLCAAPDLLRGRRVTSAHNIMYDVMNAGATYVYDGDMGADTVADGNLVTGRHPQVVDKLLDLFVEHVNASQAAPAAPVQKEIPMSFATGYSVDEARLLLTLAASAYVDEKPLPGETVQAQTTRMRRDINAALTGSAYSDWQIAWGPGLAADRGNMMYIAGNAATGQYAVAVRGTDWSFWLDWIEDFASLLPLIGFPYLVPPGGTDVLIAAGTSFGLGELIQMSGAENTPDADSDTAEAFLRALPSGTEVYITGHSLGACLASVLAAWLAWVYGGSGRLKAYTFAAPSAGNRGFADYYNRLFTHPATGLSTAYRVYNSLDSVPNAWATLSTITTYYTPSPLCPTYVKDIVDEAIKDVGTEYVQVGDASKGSAVELTGQVIPWWSWWDLDPTGTAQFVHQVAEQHHPATYLGLLSAAPVVGETVKLAAMGARIAARRAS